MNSFIESWQPQFHLVLPKQPCRFQSLMMGSSRETWPGGKKWTVVLEVIIKYVRFKQAYIHFGI